MKAEIITIGNELLETGHVDLNSTFLGEHLTVLGASVTRATTVPDAPKLISEALKSAIDKAEVVVVTGGLGPTGDDRTKQAIARALGRKLVLDEDVLAAVRAHFEKRGLPMPESNLSQAMMPEGARAIGNRLGTAPGLLLKQGETLVFILPGVPAEMRAMFESYVGPYLEGRGLRRLTEARLVRTTGLPESVLSERIGRIAKRLARVEVAYLPKATGVDIRITGRGETLRKARVAAESAQERLANELGDCVYARGDESLEQVVGYLLAMKGKTVSVAESCTGGRLGWTLTRMPGSSDYFVGGIIAYSNDLKKRLLGVKAGILKQHGAVSAETARAMAGGVRTRTRSDYGIGVTGIAGPGGGSEERPVGLVYIAVSGPRGEKAREFRLAGGRDSVRKQACQSALDMLRRVLLNLPADPVTSQE